MWFRLVESPAISSGASTSAISSIVSILRVDDVGQNLVVERGTGDGRRWDVGGGGDGREGGVEIRLVGQLGPGRAHHSFVCLFVWFDRELVELVEVRRKN